MKTTVLPSILALALLTGNALALTPVKESFNGTALNKTRWFQHKQDHGVLAPKNGKLNYFTKGAAMQNDFASIELLTSQPGYNESWQLILDLTNTSGAGTKAAGGLMLFNVQDRNDYLFLEFYGKPGLRGGVITDGEHGDNSITLPKATSKGSLRISFDKTSKLLSLDISATNKAQGYQWIPVGTFSPSGKGGNIRANWKMNPGGGRFGVQLFGFDFKVKVLQNKITYDNFEISAKP
jgi:hypothetical protein